MLLLLVFGVVALLYVGLSSVLSSQLNIGALKRLETIQRFYTHADPSQPLRVVLGDSIAIGAVDCNQLDQRIGDRRTSFNLGMPAKSNAEFLLDAAQPALHNAEVIVLFNPLAVYASKAQALEPRRANLLRQLDYPLDEAAWRGYARLLPDSGVDYLFAPRYVHVFDSRWRVRSHLEQQLKLSLPGVPVATKQQLRYLHDVYTKDLKYAALPVEPTAAQLKVKLRERLLANAEALSQGGFNPSPSSRAAYQYALGQLAANSGSVVLVLAPLHPDLAVQLGPRALADIRRLAFSYASGKVQVLDCAALLTASDFGDEVHLNRSGAEKLTRELARALGSAASPFSQ